jgi:lysophospholipase L1-like esterase
MRKFCLFLALACACSTLFAEKAPPLGGQKVLWLGDSITQAGDYVTIVEYYLNRQYTSARFDFDSIGLSSENTSCLTETDHPFPRPCLSERLGRALDLIQPQLVIACYGMNDGIYHPQSPERMAAFQKGIQGLISAVRAKNARLILLTPPPFDAVPVAAIVRDESAADFSYKAPYRKYDDVLRDYAAWEKTLAAPDITVIDLHTAIGAYLAQQRKSDPKFSFTKDGIHPNFEGHLLMAQTILGNFKIKFPHDSLSEEAARIQSDPIFVLVKSRREKLSQSWLAYVGYTRDKRVKEEYPATAEKAAVDIQQQIDIMRK